MQNNHTQQIQKFWSILFLFAVLINLNNQLCFSQIVGNESSCLNTCETYTISPTTTSDFYTWTVSGGTTSNINGLTTTICWTSTGTQNISVYNANTASTTTLSVNVVANELPVIQFPETTICDAPFECDTITTEPYDSLLAAYPIDFTPGIQIFVENIGDYAINDDCYQAWGTEITTYPLSNDIVDLIYVSADGITGFSYQIVDDLLAFSGFTGLALYSQINILEVSNGIATYNTTGEIATFDLVDGFCGQAVATYQYEIYNEVSGGLAPVLVSSIATITINVPCNVDIESIGNLINCKTVCSNTIQQYAVSNTYTNYNWEVVGAESYTSTGNELNVSWGEEGEGLIGITTTSANGCEANRSQCIEIIALPSSNIVSSPAAVANNITICENQVINFSNGGNGFLESEWQFGDGSASNDNSTEHAYSSAGIYTVQLVSISECYCTDTTSIQVEVLPGNAPTIECVSTVCAGDEGTYYTNAVCSTYNWSVENGNIIAGGGTSDDYVTVLWPSGSMGTLSLLTDGCASTACNIEVSENIPIIDDGAGIEGNTIVCAESSHLYTTTLFEGANYNWWVTDGAFIANGQGTNQVTLNFSTPFTYESSPTVTLYVNYENCYLNCSGIDSLVIDILPFFEIYGTASICTESTQSLGTVENNGFGSVPANWHFTYPDGSVVNNVYTNASFLNHEWTIAYPPGLYMIEAEAVDPSSVCNESYTVWVNVAEPPPAPIAINGETNICPDNTYIYNSSFPSIAGTVHWLVENGTGSYEETGNSISVTWGTTPPYSLTVWQEGSQTPNCSSDSLSINLNTIADLAIMGSDLVCIYDNETYTATEYSDLAYEWTLTPSDAGVIVGGNTGSTISVDWMALGTHQLTVSSCGLSHTISVEVTVADVAVNSPETICPNELTTVSTVGTYASYSWQNSEGDEFSNTASIDVEAGTYTVFVTDENGCESNTSFTIAEYPSLSFNVSSLGDNSYCLPIIPIPILEVNTYPDIALDYQWYHLSALDVSTPVGTNAPTYDAASMTEPDGRYYVIVSDENGCNFLSDTLSVRSCLNGGGVCPNPSNPCSGQPLLSPPSADWNFAGSCFDIQLNNTTGLGYVSGTAIWYVKIGADYIPYFGENPIITFDEIGNYVYYLQVDVETATTPPIICTVELPNQIITVPLVADFAADTVCVGNSTQFTDLSQLIEGSITAYEWNFDDVASGTSNISNLSNPTHVFTSAGVYDVSLTVNSSLGCSQSVTKTVVVEQNPTITINALSEVCVGLTVPFVTNYVDNVTEWAWDFDDPASGATNTSTAQNANHAFNNVGTYLVTATATTPLGCTSSVSHVIEVLDVAYTVSINADPSLEICQAETTTLSVNDIFDTYLWSNGATSPSITVGTQGNYNLTVTDANGCSAVSNDVALVVNDLPNADIIGYTNDGHNYTSYFSFCDGKQVDFYGNYNASYTYQWSNSSINYYAFNYDYDIGLNTIGLTVNNGICTNSSELSFTVNPLPSPVSISTSNSCVGDGLIASLSIDSPQANLTYTWSNGAAGESIEVGNGGTYFAIATNEFGCSINSNILNIYDTPNVRGVPNGCYLRCNTDTICFPNFPSSYNLQWLFDNAPIFGGASSPLIATESGDYQLIVTTPAGCTDTSEVLSLEIAPGYGTISGLVFEDINGNLIQDVPDDVAIENINVILLYAATGTSVATATTLVDGTYSFINIPAADYEIQVDESSLPDGYVLLSSNNAAITVIGCDNEYPANFAIQDQGCIPITVTAPFIYDVCPLDYVDIEGNQIFAGNTETITLQTSEGCDSTITVAVNALPTAQVDSTAFVCENGSLSINGVTLLPYDSEDFFFTAANGCDSVFSITVLPIPVVENTLEEQVCFGETLLLNGNSYTPGTTVLPSLIAANGCDSIVTLIVTELPEIPTTFNEIYLCEGDFINVAGYELTVGDFYIDNYNTPEGCEYTEQTDILAYPNNFYTYSNTSSCEGQNNGSITVMPDGAGIYQYSIDDGLSFQVESEFSNLAAGSYTIYIQDENNCLQTLTTEIIEIETLELTINEAMLDCMNESVTLSANLSSIPAGIGYLWSTGDTTATLTVNQAANYELTVTTPCEVLQASTEVRENEYTPPFIVPTAFTPNQDGINDAFCPIPLPNNQIANFEFMVYNRWGDRMFHTTTINDCWNGLHQGQTCEMGVLTWFYTANVTHCGETIELFEKGNVTLIW